MFPLLSFIFLVSKQYFIASFIHCAGKNLKKQAVIYPTESHKELAMVCTQAGLSFSAYLRNGFTRIAKSVSCLLSP